MPPAQPMRVASPSLLSGCQPLLYVCSYDRCDLVDYSRATVVASSRSLAAFNVHTAVLLSRANAPTSLCSRVATARSQPGVASLSELCELTRKQSCAARRSSTSSFCQPHLGRFLLLFCRRREYEAPRAAPAVHLCVVTPSSRKHNVNGQHQPCPSASCPSRRSRTITCTSS